MQRERRDQVEPRCAERWHLRDDEQFDLAAWFPSLSKATASLISGAVVLFYLDVSFAIKLLLVCTFCGSYEINKLHHLAPHFHHNDQKSPIEKKDETLDGNDYIY